VFSRLDTMPMKSEQKAKNGLEPCKALASPPTAPSREKETVEKAGSWMR